MNALPSEWSKFVIDVKLAKSLYTTNYDQLYAYLSQHERHANEVRITRERYPDPLALVANSPTLYNPSQSPQHSGSSMYPPPQQFPPVYAAPIHHQYHHTLVNPQQHSVSPQPFISPSVTQHSQADFPQLDSGLAVPTFQQGEDLIECINKAMTFLSAVASKFSPSNNQLRTFSNPRDKAIIQDGRVIVQQDSDCDDLSLAKAVLMANLSSCDSDVLSEVPYSDSSLNDMINQDVQEMHNLLVLSLVEQMTDHVAHLDKENQTNKMVNESLTAELERYKERVTIFEQRLNVDLNKHEKLIDSQMDDLIQNRNAKLAAFQQEIDTLKQTLSNNVKENNVIAKEHAMISVTDDEETLILEEESRSKMLDKQNDPISIEKKIKISPIVYSKLIEIKEDFEAAVDQCSVEKNTFEIQIKQLSIDNDQLLKQIMSQEIVHIAVNSVDCFDVKKSYVNDCNKCLELETGLLKKKDFIEKDVYD
ncbi:hypothetical protein Tco_0174477 [Tanacetum coccineum]